MWESSDFGNNQSGGFYNSPGGFDTPGGKPDKSTRRTQNVIPVCIRQIHDSPEDSLKIGSTDVHMITLVALVRRIEVQSTKITYLLDDCSGGISGVFWIETGENDEHRRAMPQIMENTYCRVYGSMRTNQGKKHVFVFRIMSVTDANELTRHLLEVMYCPLKIQAAESKAFLGPSMQSSNVNMTNSFMGNTNMSDPTGFNPQQTLVYNAIMKNSKDIGAHRDEIMKDLAGKMSGRDVINIVDFLCNEGHIYTTIDDEHFRCTDN